MLYQSASLEICVGVDVGCKRHQVAVGLSIGQLLDGMTAGTVLKFKERDNLTTLDRSAALIFSDAIYETDRPASRPPPYIFCAKYRGI